MPSGRGNANPLLDVPVLGVPVAPEEAFCGPAANAENAPSSKPVVKASARGAWEIEWETLRIIALTVKSLVQNVEAAALSKTDSA
jgi:hypothetical protein